MTCLSFHTGGVTTQNASVADIDGGPNHLVAKYMRIRIGQDFVFVWARGVWCSICRASVLTVFENNT